MNKIALFDFCETIANFQTADAYVDFVRERLHDCRMCRLEKMQVFLRTIKVIQIVEIITRYRFSINKRIKLWQLRGHGLAELQALAREYYQERIKPNFIPEMMGKLLELKAQGYSIFLVSGGYNIYLRYFAEENDLSGVISTKVGFKNDVCTGKFDGIDCLREEKTKLLNQYFKKKPKYSIAFSDSITDIPFLKWADEGYVVSRNKHQIWSKKNKLNEIIWTEKRK
jgi:HAD superfamily hydrolase (TIGR01490 family)